MIDRDFWTSTTIAPIGALAELRALVLARSKKRATLPTVALGSFRATTASAGRARPRHTASQLQNFSLSVSKFLDAGGDSPGDIFGGFGEAKTAPREGIG